MTDIQPFNLKRWIDINCFCGPTLKRETLDVVSNFTLLWNLFEGTVCHGDARRASFPRLAENIARRASLPGEIERILRFWKARYLFGTNFNDRFRRLRLHPDDQMHVETVLRGEKSDPRSQLLAVMLIIYRLRNNLFHGLKEIQTLNEQAPSLNYACQVIAAIIEISPAPIIKQAA